MASFSLSDKALAALPDFDPLLDKKPFRATQNVLYQKGIFLAEWRGICRKFTGTPFASFTIRKFGWLLFA
jgi:hypothetical protein